MNKNATNSLVREKLLLLLCTLYITIDLACDVTAHRYVDFFSLTFIGSALIYPLTYFINDVIAELFGYEAAKTMIWLGIVADFVFSFLIIGIIHLPSPHFWGLRESFIDVLQPMLRLNIAGLVGIIAGRFLNIYIISKLKIIMHGRMFWFRSIFASSVGVCAHSLILYV